MVMADGRTDEPKRNCLGLWHGRGLRRGAAPSGCRPAVGVLILLVGGAHGCTPTIEGTVPSMAPSSMPASSPAESPATSMQTSPPVFGDRSRIYPHSLPCDLATLVSDPSEIGRTRGQTPQEIADELVGNYGTHLEWATLIPPFEDGAAEERVTLLLTFTGEARLFPRCQNLVELDMRVGLRSESGALAFDAPARFISPRKGEGRITTEFQRGGSDQWESSSNLVDWKKEIESVSRLSVNGFRVDLVLMDGALMGRFAVQGGTGATCDLALWPAGRPCRLGEHVVDGKAPFRGLLAEHVVRGLKGLERSHQVRWEDTGATTEMTIEFSPDPSSTVCVLGEISDPTALVNYEVLGRVSLATDDGRLDVSLPVRAVTRGTEEDWETITIASNGLVNPEPGSGTHPESGAASPNATVLLGFSSPRREVWAGGTTFVSGGLDVRVLELQSPRVKTTGGACSAGDFMGRLRLVTSATFQ
jgi:hypothetical protein